MAASDSVGWMLRGGVAIGQLYIDEVMVWGKALLTAYELEDKVANYPRVIIDEDVVNEISSVQDLQEYLRLYLVRYAVILGLFSGLSFLWTNADARIRNYEEGSWIHI